MIKINDFKDAAWYEPKGEFEGMGIRFLIKPLLPTRMQEIARKFTVYWKKDKNSPAVKMVDEEKRDRVFFEVVYDLIEDWEGIMLEENGTLKKAPCTPENKKKVLDYLGEKIAEYIAPDENLFTPEKPDVIEEALAEVEVDKNEKKPVPLILALIRFARDSGNFISK